MFVVKEMERRMEEEEESIKATIRERLGEKFDLEFKLKVRMRELTFSCFSRYNGVYGFSLWFFLQHFEKFVYLKLIKKKSPYWLDTVKNFVSEYFQDVWNVEQEVAYVYKCLHNWQ